MDLYWNLTIRSSEEGRSTARSSACLIKEDKFSLETTLVPHEAKRCGAAGINGIR